MSTSGVTSLSRIYRNDRLRGVLALTVGLALAAALAYCAYWLIDLLLWFHDFKG
jgi:hypothetical protein